MPSRNPNALVKVDRERPRHFERPDIRPLRSPNIHRVPIPVPRIPAALGGVRRRGGRRRQRGVRRLRFRRGWDMRTFSGRFVRIEDDSPCRLVRGSAERYTAPYADSFSIHMRASPSGKASASQADTRGFESRCPLQEFQGTGDGAFLFSGLISGTRTRWGREAAGTRERSPASARGGRRPPEHAGAAGARESRCPLQELQGTGDGAFLFSGRISGDRTRWGREAAGTGARSPPPKTTRNAGCSNSCIASL